MEQFTLEQSEIFVAVSGLTPAESLVGRVVTFILCSSHKTSLLRPSQISSRRNTGMDVGEERRHGRFNIKASKVDEVVGPA